MTDRPGTIAQSPLLCLSLPRPHSPRPHSTGWCSDQWEQRSVMFTGHQWALAPPPTVSWPMGRGLGSSEQTMFSMIISVNIRRSNATSGVSPDCLTSFINGFIDRLHCMNVGSGFVVSSVYRGVASHTMYNTGPYASIIHFYYWRFLRARVSHVLLPITVQKKLR